MFVNNYKIKVGSTDGFIKIPISMDFITVDQAEVVEVDFVIKEVEKAINPIIDYEKARFTPTDNVGSVIFNLAYELNFLNDADVLLPQTNYSDIGFINDDIKYRKNGFMRSFLRLNFYDNEVPTNQRLVSFITIYPKIGKSDVNPIGSPNAGLPKGANMFPVKFVLNNPITNPDGFAEGFYLYHYKDEVFDNLPKELFMRAEFNNAKTGKRTSFVTVNAPQTIDNVVGKLHTKYILKRDNTGFYYALDTTYSTNIVYTGDVNDDGQLNDAGVKIKLYEIQVL